MIDILVIGDFHIPKRGSEIPPIIKKKLHELISQKYFDFVVCTGDIVRSPDTINYLKSLANKKFFVVQGNMDYFYGNREAPLFEKLFLKGNDNSEIIIGLTHGDIVVPRGDKHELCKIAEENKSNILISGHTHSADIFLTDNGVLLLNPGSCTGAWSFVASGIPSFMIMRFDPKSNYIEITLYELKSNSIETKTDYFRFKDKQIFKI